MKSPVFRNILISVFLAPNAGNNWKSVFGFPLQTTYLKEIRFLARGMMTSLKYHAHAVMSYLVRQPEVAQATIYI